jgi:hypothetical protein
VRLRSACVRAQSICQPQPGHCYDRTTLPPFCDPALSTATHEASVAQPVPSVSAAACSSQPGCADGVSSAHCWQSMSCLC